MTTPEMARITLPTNRLLAVAVGGPMLAAIGWSIVTLLGPWGVTALWQGLVAVGVVVVVSVATTMAIMPWRERTILTWGTTLLAASLGRIAATIGICLLLYSAARLSAGPLLIGALAGLLPVLVGETSVVANRFKREAS